MAEMARGAVRAAFSGARQVGKRPGVFLRLAAFVRRSFRPLWRGRGHRGAMSLPGMSPVYATARGYTLIEVVAVLAVLAILAAVVTPRVITSMKNTARQTEGADLATMREGLEKYILRTKQIPSAATWVQVLSTELAVAANRVSATKADVARAYFVDPALRIGTNSSQTLPFAQTVNGSIQPISPRVMIISSLVKPLPALNAGDFNALWATPNDTAPAGWPAAWQSFREDLKIQRIDLRGLFHRVIIRNADTVNRAVYSVENTLTALIPGVGSPVIQMWLLDGTTMGFYDTNGIIQAREFVRRDTSYIYEDNHWGRDFSPDDFLGPFGQMAEDFLAARRAPTAEFGSTQQAVVDEFYTYLWTYGVWANEGFPKGGSSSAQLVPSMRVVDDSQNRLDDFSANLIK